MLWEKSREPLDRAGTPKTEPEKSIFSPSYYAHGSASILTPSVSTMTSEAAMATVASLWEGDWDKSGRDEL